MLDFLKISTRSNSKGVTEVYPKFICMKSKDLMIRGNDFYAIWDEVAGRWDTDEDTAKRLIDDEVRKEVDKLRESDTIVKPLYMWDSDSKVIDKWHWYCKKQLRDCYHPLDETLIFSNYETKKENYSSKKLPYPLEDGDHSSFDKLMSVLYSDEERMKILWAIGSIVSGDSKKIQKFLVLYGSGGSGKSTVLNIIEKLFVGYYTVFDAKALGSSNNQFSLEPFKCNPLVAIQHDGDLSRIEDNTKLNSLISHEKMTINEKFKSTYVNDFKCFLFMGSNKPVKITDAKSGLIRRLIDVSPSGNKLPRKEYDILLSQIDFELGAIAKYCLDLYLNNKDLYDDYVPITMLGASNDFYNFILDSYHVFVKEDGVSLKTAWQMYTEYCEWGKVPYPLNYRTFREELKNYFQTFQERATSDDGSRIRSYYSGFKIGLLHDNHYIKNETNDILLLKKQHSLLDDELRDCPAQLTNDSGLPLNKWNNVKSKLSDIDTSELHFVKPPKNMIVIDFDFTNENGEKDSDLNIKEAGKWPKTYAELSKGGGVHLHYYYDGDVSLLKNVFDSDAPKNMRIEIKTFNGNASLRRKLTLCNDIPIRHISSGLPLKEVKKMYDKDVMLTEKGLITTIKKCLKKEVHANTKPNIDFIFKILDDAYHSGMSYDVRLDDSGKNLVNAVIAFAASSTNKADECLKIVDKMHFCSDDILSIPESDGDIVFFDIEVFPNLFLVNWKIRGSNNPVYRMINPSSSDIEELMNYKLVGFNNRRYDNHILYARLIGYSIEQLYDYSQKIINSDKGAAGVLYSSAYNISYTDVYDFAATKQSLKKWEIELGIHHQELGLPWDKPVPENMWGLVAEYCDNDVIATEKVFEHLQSDFLARKILADISGGSVNDTTNMLSTKFIFGSNKNPQSEFNYRNLGYVDDSCYTSFVDKFDGDAYDDPGNNLQFTMFNSKHQPVFPGYIYDAGKSIYRDEVIGEGGYVYSEPGVYYNVALLDVASMHPSSLIAECLLGERYTKRFEDIKNARIAIKHKDFSTAREMFDGALIKYLNDENQAKDLAQALKIVINSVYGLTAAKFPNAFRDNRNFDNIVAKRGALFMVNLKHEVQARGFTVAHIKTDSIKIPDATPEIIQFVMDYGKMYGYTFEHEDTYERMCLVNKSVYIARSFDGHWSPTGTQFAVPYVFKTLFSKEPLVFDDFCETKSVQTAIYIDKNEDLPDGEHNYVFVGKIGRFCPMKAGVGAGHLYAERKAKDGSKKYDSVSGCSDYIWMESEEVLKKGLQDFIDTSFYEKLVNDALYGGGSGKDKMVGIADFEDPDVFLNIDYKSPWSDDDGNTYFKRR